MAYIDGYVIAVPNANKQAYLDLAIKMAALFKQHGAIRVTETWGDDVPEGKLTSFSLAVKREDQESIVFSWIEWPSKEARNEAWQVIMSDPMMQGASELFDGKRMIFGGFDVIMDA
jgi:uncharacterized protein YbaA (DUF1428 family)